MSGTLNPYRHQYETVATNQTNQVLGGTGATGDFLHRLVVNVTATASGFVILLDGSTTVWAVPINFLANGVYNYEFNMASQNGGWKVSTGAGSSAIGIGTFTN